MEQRKTLDSWSGHVFKLGRSPMVLFMHDASLWHILIPAKGITTLEKLLPLFLARVRQVWSDHGVEFDDKNLSLGFLPRSDRSLIGSMNDAIHQIRCYAEMGLKIDDPTGLAEIEDRLHKTPYSSLGYGFPDRKLNELLSRQG